MIPFDLSENWSLIARPVIPIVHQPWPESANGLSDIGLQLLLSPEKSGKFIWGAGPAFLFPTATSDIIGPGSGRRVRRWRAYTRVDHGSWASSSTNYGHLPATTAGRM